MLIRFILFVILLTSVAKITSFQETIFLWEEQFHIDIVILSIGLILLLGVELLCATGLWQRKLWAIKLSLWLISLLSLITGYQFYLGVENCGCFGTFLSFTPMETLIKNALLIGCLIYLYKKEKGIEYV